MRAGAARLLAAAQDLQRRPPSLYCAGQAREARRLERFARTLLSGVGDQLELAL